MIFFLYIYLLAWVMRGVITFELGKHFLGAKPTKVIHHCQKARKKNKKKQYCQWSIDSHYWSHENKHKAIVGGDRCKAISAHFMNMIFGNMNLVVFVTSPYIKSTRTFHITIFLSIKVKMLEKKIQSFIFPLETLHKKRFMLNSP